MSSRTGRLGSQKAPSEISMAISTNSALVGRRQTEIGTSDFVPKESNPARRSYLAGSSTLPMQASKLGQAASVSSIGKTGFNIPSSGSHSSLVSDSPDILSHARKGSNGTVSHDATIPEGVTTQESMISNDLNENETQKQFLGFSGDALSSYDPQIKKTLIDATAKAPQGIDILRRLFGGAVADPAKFDVNTVLKGIEDLEKTLADTMQTIHHLESENRQLRVELQSK